MIALGLGGCADALYEDHQVDLAGAVPMGAMAIAAAGLIRRRRTRWETVESVLDSGVLEPDVAEAVRLNRSERDA